jgi:heme/copper-type cytochrome/quinol oxidase subunit 2
MDIDRGLKRLGLVLAGVGALSMGAAVTTKATRLDANWQAGMSTAVAMSFVVIWLVFTVLRWIIRRYRGMPGPKEGGEKEGGKT